jgi:hypothetical protein
MSGLLEDRVALYVSAHPGLTARKVAAELRARHQSVRAILDSPAFSAEPGPGGARTYRLVGVASELRPCAPRARLTHKQRVLALLQDGKPHSHMEGYRLGVMLHSRVADLRRDGYRIECSRHGDLYCYRLLFGPLDAEEPKAGEEAYLSATSRDGIGSVTSPGAVRGQSRNPVRAEVASSASNGFPRLPAPQREDADTTSLPVSAPQDAPADGAHHAGASPLQLSLTVGA